MFFPSIKKELKISYQLLTSTILRWNVNLHLLLLNLLKRSPVCMLRLFFFWYHSVCLNNHYNKLWLSKTDRQLKSYFLSCLLSWVAQFNFRIAFKALKEKKKIAVCLSWLKKCKYSCVLLVVELCLVVICPHDWNWFKYMKVHQGWVSVSSQFKGGVKEGEVLQLNGGGWKSRKGWSLCLFS